MEIYLSSDAFFDICNGRKGRPHLFENFISNDRDLAGYIRSGAISEIVENHILVQPLHISFHNSMRSSVGSM